MRMFKLNKIRGHVKMLEFQQLKLTRYLSETQAKTPVDDKRIKDINRALKRVTDNIAMWNNKISAFEAQPSKTPSRPAIGDDDPTRPLIG